MTTLIEEMKLVVLQIWQSLGFERSSKTAAAVIPVLVLGVALNVIALNTVVRAHDGNNAVCEKVKLTGVTRTEFRVVRAVVVSTLKRIGEGRRGVCSARQWVLEQRAEAAHLRNEMGCGRMAHAKVRGISLSTAMRLPEMCRCRQSTADMS